MATIIVRRIPAPLTVSVATLLLALGFALVLDQVRTRTAPTTPQPVERVAAADRRPAGERAVQEAQARLATMADDQRAAIGLAQAFLLRARETGDPGYYSRADALLGPALAARPDDVEAVVAAGELALARHDFAAALDWGRRAVQLAPFRSMAHGVLVDALVELGRYDEAVAAAQRMVDTRPDLASYSRVSYLRELHGDLPGATEAMRRAVEAGPPRGEATAWSEVQLGHLLFAQGDLDGAQRAYEGSTRRVDDYVHGLAGLARVRAARGDLEGAAALYERAAQTLPLPEAVIALGDVSGRLGDETRARQQYDLLAAMQRLMVANGVRIDLELALFNADRGVDLDAALEAAQAEYARRPSIQVADTLAWVEYRAGRLAEAATHSREALRLGTRDPLLLYHAGVIAQANRERERAYELLKASSDLNPRYSLRWADDLAARLRALEEEVGR